MQERTLEAIAKANDQQRSYIKHVAGVSTADELIKLSELKEKGVLTDAEFETQKVKLLTFALTSTFGGSARRKYPWGESFHFRKNMA